MHFSYQCVIVFIVVATLASSISAATLHHIRKCPVFCKDLYGRFFLRGQFLCFHVGAAWFMVLTRALLLVVHC
ncbi:hypothetical protein EV702DRAFT_1087638 [Suillus placidus]|uniref:Secreted peptide n=1 Tax=Suillus placidus TaxID=48579 RepID=A0A9P7A0S9_9AGAM|nr:hypothetical protein EV702DRAFT_1087638 [Suillus placidus]